MEENNLYWLKLPKDFFKDNRIVLLEKSSRRGPEFVLFYMKLMLESLSTGGYLRMPNDEPLTNKNISMFTFCTEKFVSCAISALKTYKLIQFIDEKTLYFSQVEKLIGKSANNPNALRQRAFRERKKDEGNDKSVTFRNADVTESVTKNNESIELDTRVKKIDKEREKERERTITVVDSRSIPSLEEVKAYAREKDSAVNPVRFFNYYQSRQWKVNGQPIADWKAMFECWESRNQDFVVMAAPVIPSKELPILQREVTEEELEALVGDPLDDLPDFLRSAGDGLG